MTYAPLDRRAVLRRSLSVAAATAAYGVSLGALAVANALSIEQAGVSSLLLFSGGSQFALVGVLGAGGGLGAAEASSASSASATVSTGCS